MAQQHILVLGSGGREHAICWKIAQSPLTAKLYCAPGNAGTAQCAENIALGDSTSLVNFCKNNAITLVVIGPEAPLVDGVADTLRENGIVTFGPSSAAAQLEASKAFTRTLCSEMSIPGARWQACKTIEDAQAVLHEWGAPIVIKADGLAAGKGVVVAATIPEAEQALLEIMQEGSMGTAGDIIVLEECLVGLEASLFVLCDNETALPLALARDHKRIGEGDTGPNTGGMGCFTPIGDDAAITAEVMESIIAPSLHGMAQRGTPFQGVLFAGLMLTEDGAKLIEYNVRFGDPECQALMLQMDADLLPLLLATAEGRLDSQPPPRWHQGHIVNVVLAAQGYPAAYEKGLPLPELPENSPDRMIFHAGTVRNSAGQLVSAGGRVLNICARGHSLDDARKKAYAICEAIDWRAGYYRRDIGNAG